MPKIKSYTKTVSNGKSEIRLDYDVMYNQDHHFYIEIPKVFEETFSLMPRDQLKPFNAETVRMGRAYGKQIVSSFSEAGVLGHFHDIIKHLLSSTTEERPVIMLFYQDTGGSYNSHKYNDEHEQLGLLFGLTYAIEIALPGGGKKYCVEHKVKNLFVKEGEPEFRVNREFFSPWSCPIIDDTPENRAKLDSLYIGFKNIKIALESLSKTSESVLNFIENSTQLFLTENISTNEK